MTIRKHEKIIALLSLTVFFLAGYLYLPKIRQSRESNISQSQITEETLTMQNQPSSDETMPVKEVVIAPPLDKITERVNKKPFGIFVSPKNSPVNPEVFTGYHTAIDLEVFPEEVDSEIEVKSACDGKIILKNTANGYGGFLVQLCQLNGAQITVIYGHIKLSSVLKNVSDNLTQGEKIGVLGDAYSRETDGERKHLHFGIHKGDAVNILGYVQNKDMLMEWIDPCLYICK